jgi:hypothetical protein
MHKAPWFRDIFLISGNVGSGETAVGPRRASYFLEKASASAPSSAVLVTFSKMPNVYGYAWQGKKVEALSSGGRSNDWGFHHVSCSLLPTGKADSPSYPAPLGNRSSAGEHQMF